MNDEVYKAIGFMRLISGQAVDCHIYEERPSRDFMNDMQRFYQDIIDGKRGPDFFINWNELLRASKEELNMLGFMNWDNNSKFHLIPLWIFPFVPDDMILTSFNGVSCKKSEIKDLDTRFGCLAYGVMREVEDWNQLRNDWFNGLTGGGQMKTRPIEQLADWAEVTAARFGLQNPVLTHHLKKTRQIIKALKREAQHDKRTNNI